MDDPQRIEIRQGGGIASLIGLIFVGAGIALLIMLTDEAPWFVVPFVSVFILIGLAVMLARSAFTCDGRQRLITSWWGFLVPMSTRTIPFDRVTCVAYSKRRVRTKNSSYTIYPIKIEATEGRPLTVENPRDLSAARKRAEQLAKLVGSAIEDRTGETPQRREAEMLDASLADQLADQPLEWPELSAGSAIEYELVDDAAHITLPRPRLGPLLALGIGFLVLFVLPPVVAVTFAMVSEGNPTALALVAVIAGVVLLLPVAAVITIMRRLKVQEHVIVARDRLIVEKRRGRHAERVEIPAAELEQLADASDGRQVPGFLNRAGLGPPLRAVSDTSEVTFGGTLSPPDRAWLRDALRFILAGR